MNIKLRFHVYHLFLIVKKKFVLSVEKQNWAKQSTVAGGCGYPCYPGCSLGEDYSHQGVNSILRSAPFLCIKPVVVISEANLGDIKGAALAPLAHICSHIHRSHNPFHFACCFSIQSVFNRCKHVRLSVFEV